VLDYCEAERLNLLFQTNQFFKGYGCALHILCDALKNLADKNSCPECSVFRTREVSISSRYGIIQFALREWYNCTITWSLPRDDQPWCQDFTYVHTNQKT
jgi:hypothetical protein